MEDELHDAIIRVSNSMTDMTQNTVATICSIKQFSMRLGKAFNDYRKLGYMQELARIYHKPLYVRWIWYLRARELRAQLGL